MSTDGINRAYKEELQLLREKRNELNRELAQTNKSIMRLSESWAEKLGYEIGTKVIYQGKVYTISSIEVSVDSDPSFELTAKGLIVREASIEDISRVVPLQEHQVKYELSWAYRIEDHPDDTAVICKARFNKLGKAEDYRDRLVRENKGINIIGVTAVP